MLNDLLIRLRALFRRKSVESELDDEVQFHFDQQVAKYIASGMPRAEATRRARLEFGGLEQVKEECRDARGVRFLETLAQDIRYGLRILRKSPGFTIVAVLTLALGIGANTAIFSVIEAVILRPLSYPEASRLVMVWSTTSGPRSPRDVSSYPMFVDWKTDSHSFEGMAAFAERSFNWIGKDEPQSLIGLRVSPGLFSILRISPQIGRSFAVEETQPGKSQVAILSNEFWTNRLAGQPNIIGSTLSLDGERYTVIGVMPGGFHFPPNARPALYVPLEPDPNRGHGFLSVVARLKPMATIREAQAETHSISQRSAKDYPQYGLGGGAIVFSLRASLVQDFQVALWTLLGAVTFVLLICCANVANLSMARSAVRRKEFAVRAALGAGKGRLTQQMLTESVLLGLAGGAIGLLVAYCGIRGVLALLGRHLALPRIESVGINGVVLLFALLTALVTGILFGLAPALGTVAPHLNESLKEGNRSARGHGGARLHDFLVVAEVALAVILLAGAGLLIQTFVRLTRVHLGFQPDRVLTLDFAFPRSQDLPLPRRAAMLRQILDRVEALPGVRSAGTAADLPLGGGSDSMGVSLPQSADPSRSYGVQTNIVSSDYFQTLGIPLLVGRSLTSSDDDSAPPVIVINEKMARGLWPDATPIGKQISLSKDSKPFTVVGVVGDSRDIGPSQQPEKMAFFSAYQDPFLWRWVSLAIRTDSDPAKMAGTIRAAVWSQFPSLPISRTATLNDILSNSVAEPRAYMCLLAVFAGLALVLAAVGLYGVISYSVSQRTHEIGLRMALGAQSTDVLRLVVGHGIFLVLGGLAAGIAGALMLTRLLAGLLYGVTASDTPTYVMVSAALSAVAVAASLVPARRAMRVDPLVALRHE